jgi:hypothetical protein
MFKVINILFIFFDISPKGPNKKAGLPHPRQPGYLSLNKRPVAFRRRLATALVFTDG